MSVLDSIDNALESATIYKPLRVLYAPYISSAGTGPLASMGGTGIALSERPFVVPSMHAALEGMYLMQARVEPAASSGGTAGIIGLQYLLGSLNIGTSVFTAGVTMPMKKYNGLPAVQTSSQLTLLAITTTLSATTPDITITYTNQEGASGRSCVYSVPTNASAPAAYMLLPQLQAGDTGMRSVQNMTKSAGAASGVMRVYGFLVLASSVAASGSEVSLEPLTSTYPLFLCEPGDTIGYAGVGNNINQHQVFMVGVGEEA